MGEPIAKQIAHQMKDGTIGALTEENFGLWFIWRKELKSRWVESFLKDSNGIPRSVFLLYCKS